MVVAAFWGKLLLLTSDQNTMTSPGDDPRKLHERSGYEVTWSISLERIGLKKQVEPLMEEEISPKIQGGTRRSSMQSTNMEHLNIHLEKTNRVTVNYLSWPTITL